MAQLLPSIRRDRARDKLRKLSAIADDAEFCRMVWAADLLQEGNSEVAAKYLKFPDEAVSPDISSRYRVHRWMSETLVNELLSTPKVGLLNYRPRRTLNCTQFDTLAYVFNALHNLEDAETGVWLRNGDMFLEMHRIAQRQFHWQRGFFNGPQFYRNAYLFNHDVANALFVERYGVSIEDFTHCGFFIYFYLSQVPFMPVRSDLSEAGFTPAVQSATIHLISLKHKEARARAKELRNRPSQTAYKPSILRQSPCILFEGNGGQICAPVRELILQRITSGLYYDLLGDGNLRNVIAKRFELYCEDMFRGHLPNIEITREFSYNSDRNRTPDLILGIHKNIFAVAECKATKMTIEAKFSDAPLEEAERGYQEILKAILQIWRFFSHYRQGIVQIEGTINPDAVGLVLTLDGWLEMFGPMRGELLRKARAHVIEADPSILEEDMKPVVFCPIDDLERTLARASLSTFSSALRAACLGNYEGYHLSSVHEELKEEKPPPQPYPFKDRLPDVLRWWGKRMRAGIDFPQD